MEDQKKPKQKEGPKAENVAQKKGDEGNKKRKATADVQDLESKVNKKNAQPEQPKKRSTKIVTYRKSHRLLKEQCTIPNNDHLKKRPLLQNNNT